MGWGGTANFVNSTPSTGGSRWKKKKIDSKNPPQNPPPIKYFVHYFDQGRFRGRAEHAEHAEEFD